MSFGVPAVGDHELPQPPSECISKVAWSPKACAKQLIAASSWDKTIRVWEVQTSVDPSTQIVREIRSQPIGMQTHTLPILSTSIGKDGTVFFAGTCKTAQMWNLTTNQMQQVAQHDMPISSVSIVEDGVAQPMLITSGWDGAIRFWDLRQQQPAKEEKMPFPIVAHDCSTPPLATFLCNRKIMVYNLQTLTKFGEEEPHANAKLPLRCVANMHNKAGILVGTVDGRCAVHGIDRNIIRENFQFKAHATPAVANRNDLFDAYQVNFVAAHPVAHNAAVTGGSDGAIRFWDVPTKRKTFDVPGKKVLNEPLQVSCGALNPDGTVLAYGLSFDWSLGKEHYNAQMPKAVSLKIIQPAWLR